MRASGQSARRGWAMAPGETGIRLHSRLCGGERADRAAHQRDGHGGGRGVAGGRYRMHREPGGATAGDRSAAHARATDATGQTGGSSDTGDQQRGHAGAGVEVPAKLVGRGGAGRRPGGAGACCLAAVRLAALAVEDHRPPGMRCADYRAVERGRVCRGHQRAVGVQDGLRRRRGLAPGLHGQRRFLAADASARVLAAQQQRALGAAEDQEVEPTA